LDKNKVLEFAIKMGVPKENIDNIKKQISEDLSREDIEIAVKAEFAPKIAALKPDLFKEVLTGTSMIDIATGKIFVNAFNAAKKIPKNQKEILKLEEQINEEIEKRIQDQKDDVTIKEGQVELTKELGDEDIERLQIERQLSNLAMQYSDDLEKVVKREIELINNSNYQVKEEEKLVKLAELQNKLVEERLKTRKKETDQVRDLLFQYEQADFDQRQKIRRQIELTTMQPGQVTQAYRSSARDRSIILENIGDFSQEVRDSISKLIALQRGIRYNPFSATQAENKFTPTGKIPLSMTYDPVQIKELIRKHIPYESLKDIAELTFPDFSKIQPISNNFATNIQAPINIEINTDKMVKETIDKVVGKLEDILPQAFIKVGSKLNKATRQANDYGGEEQP
jgi:hypothetical protein